MAEQQPKKTKEVKKETGLALKWKKVNSPLAVFSGHCV